MIKLVPSAFAPNDCPAYPSSALPASFNKALAEQLTSSSSPDTSASSQQQSFPSLKQAFAAARHSAALLSCAPRSQQKRAQAVKAAVERLEAEMSVPHPSLLAPLATGAAAAAAAAAAASSAVKRPREDDALSSPARPSPRAPPHAPSPYWSLGLGFSPGGTVGAGETATPPAGFWATDSGDVLAVAARNGDANDVDGAAAAQGGVSGPAELDELTIESLIGTDRCALLPLSRHDDREQVLTPLRTSQFLVVEQLATGGGVVVQLRLCNSSLISTCGCSLCASSRARCETATAWRGPSGSEGSTRRTLNKTAASLGQAEHKFLAELHRISRSTNRERGARRRGRAGSADLRGV